MNSPARQLLAAAIGIVLLNSCTSQETPSRDHLPILKERVYALQEAVKARDRTAIDSLLSTKIQSNQQSSDSLLSLVYGPDGAFPFERFGNCEIAYTNTKALAECYIMDSTPRQGRPIALLWVHEHDRWLLKRFEPIVVSRDTAAEGEASGP